MTEGPVELSSCLWSSTAAATDATLTRSLVLLTRSLVLDSGKRPSTPRFALQNHVGTMVSDGDTSPILRLLNQVKLPRRTIRIATTPTTLKRPRPSKSRGGWCCGSSSPTLLWNGNPRASTTMSESSTETGRS